MEMKCSTAAEIFLCQMDGSDFLYPSSFLFGVSGKPKELGKLHYYLSFFCEKHELCQECPTPFFVNSICVYGTHEHKSWPKKLSLIHILTCFSLHVAPLPMLTFPALLPTPSVDPYMMQAALQQEPTLPFGRYKQKCGHKTGV